MFVIQKSYVDKAFFASPPPGQNSVIVWKFLSSLLKPAQEAEVLGFSLIIRTFFWCLFLPGLAIVPFFSKKADSYFALEFSL